MKLFNSKRKSLKFPIYYQRHTNQIPISKKPCLKLEGTVLFYELKYFASDNRFDLWKKSHSSTSYVTQKNLLIVQRKKVFNFLLTWNNQMVRIFMKNSTYCTCTNTYPLKWKIDFWRNLLNWLKFLWRSKVTSFERQFEMKSFLELPKLRNLQN